MQPIDLKVLLEAGCHFGHKTNKWNPKASSFIYKAVGDTHIIDLAKTKEGLERAALFVKDTVQKGGTVVFVGTKRQASSIVKEAATRVGAPYFDNRWIGGFITNWEEVRKNSDKLTKLRADLADQNISSRYTKRERLLIERDINKLTSIYGGVINLDKRPNAIFLIDIRKETAAIQEAQQYNIPLIGIVDTNADPAQVQYAIPANDDAVGSITLLVNYIADAYLEGKEAAVKIQEKADQDREKQVKKDAEAKEKAELKEQKIKESKSKVQGSKPK